MREILGRTKFTRDNPFFQAVGYADTTIPGNYSASNFDLSSFYSPGGKLIHYYGLSNATFTLGASIYFHDHVKRILAPKSVKLNNFNHFFPVPGLEHYTDTPSKMNVPWYIGVDQATAISIPTNSVPKSCDANHVQS